MTTRGYYSDYLRSPYWRAVRGQMVWLFEKCERCGSGDDLQVHHQTYERLGHEWIPEDLEVLCRPCHEKHHGIPPKGTA